MIKSFYEPEFRSLESKWLFKQKSTRTGAEKIRTMDSHFIEEAVYTGNDWLRYLVDTENIKIFAKFTAKRLTIQSMDSIFTIERGHLQDDIEDMHRRIHSASKRGWVAILVNAAERDAFHFSFTKNETMQQYKASEHVDKSPDDKIVQCKYIDETCALSHGIDTFDLKKIGWIDCGYGICKVSSV